MNKSESKYYNTACLMDEALIELLDKKEFEYITVKEICNKAGVNRSTFYLHYDSPTDLLSECSEYVHEKFMLHMRENGAVPEEDGEDIYLVTPKYVVPYLEFIKENKILFETTVRHRLLFGLDHVYERMFVYVFDPIMEKIGIAEQKRRYTTLFYVNGLSAIVTEWLKNNCRESIEEITAIMCNIIPKAGAQARLTQ